MGKIIRIILIVLLILFVLIQFIRPEKNSGIEITQNEINAKFSVPENVQQILNVSCYDCHSNTTKYPWYWNIQPGAWVLSNHFNEGKRHLNFSIFSTYPANRQYKMFKEIDEQVKNGDMPLGSYTLIHRDAILNANQKQSVENWAQTSMKGMEQKYPADSLKRPNNLKKGS
ncbi:MAG TPA: heme-binding domain-containing protein [Hanamia sp.]|nr:heme-binding domain-containing protein [Hanamia sp.]